MNDPALHTAALAGLEFLVQKALALDPATTQRLAKLEGKVLLVHCSTPDIKVYCLPGKNGLQLQSWYDEKHVSSSLEGSLSEFVSLLQAEDKAASLINGAFTVKGDSADFIALQEALAQLDIDWEQPLSRLVGDMGSHHIGKMLRGSLAWGKQAHSSMQRNVEEFIHEEARLLPPRLELDNFYSDVSSLGLRVDRLEARLQRLKQKKSNEP